MLRTERSRLLKRQRRFLGRGAGFIIKQLQKVEIRFFYFLLYQYFIEIASNIIESGGGFIILYRMRVRILRGEALYLNCGRDIINLLAFHDWDLGNAFCGGSRVFVFFKSRDILRSGEKARRKSLVFLF
jgi:hypothetical protein